MPLPSFKRHWFIKGIALILLVSILFQATPLVQQSDSVCDAEAFMTAKQPAIAIHPHKVVVHPWHGLHRVYGIFMLPTSVRPGTEVLLTVRDVGIYCDRDRSQQNQRLG